MPSRGENWRAFLLEECNPVISGKGRASKQVYKHNSEKIPPENLKSLILGKSGNDEFVKNLSFENPFEKEEQAKS